MAARDVSVMYGPISREMRGAGIDATIERRRADRDATRPPKGGRSLDREQMEKSPTISAARLPWTPRVIAGERACIGSFQSICTYKDIFILRGRVALDLLEISLFGTAAVVLLGSPGPGIAALVAVGRDCGFVGGLRFYWGLQAGLALAAAISAAGLLSLVQAIPFAAVALTTLATTYLIWLAYKIATAPVGADGAGQRTAIVATVWGGFVLGVTNPKAYTAFASIMAAYLIVRSNSAGDLAIKWLICVAVMMSVDIAWLWAGGILGKARLKPRQERALNIVMSGAIVATTLLALR